MKDRKANRDFAIASARAFGGAMPHSAVGYVDVEDARRRLDDGWEFVGEVNQMRAYRQPGRAACLLRWEDFLQQKLGLPPWRVFAGASLAFASAAFGSSIP